MFRSSGDRIGVWRASSKGLNFNFQDQEESESIYREYTSQCLSKTTSDIINIIYNSALCGTKLWVSEYFHMKKKKSAAQVKVIDTRQRMRIIEQKLIYTKINSYFFFFFLSALPLSVCPDRFPLSPNQRQSWNEHKNWGERSSNSKHSKK